MAKFKVVQGVSRGGYQLYVNTQYDTINFSSDFIKMLETERVISYAGEVTDDFEEIQSSLAQIANLTNHSITYSYYSDGNVQTVAEKDSDNNVVQTVTYNYNASGDVSTSVTVTNGKTVTTTYNYDASGNITSTSNVIS